MNFLKNLWTRIKNFFSNLFNSKPVEPVVEAELPPISKATEVFEAAYAAAPSIEFNSHWNNGTGYYDHAVEGEHAPKLAVGEIVKAKSPAANNRKIIIVGTELGNVVIFERFTAGAHGVYVANTSTVFVHAHGSFGGELHVAQIRTLLNHVAKPLAQAA